MKPVFKAPGTERLKLKCDEPLSSFAFKFKCRRYTTEVQFKDERSGNFQIIIIPTTKLLISKEGPTVEEVGRGLNSSTSQLNLSDVYGIGGARRGCAARVKGVLGV